MPHLGAQYSRELAAIGVIIIASFLSLLVETFFIAREELMQQIFLPAPMFQNWDRSHTTARDTTCVGPQHQCKSLHRQYMFLDAYFGHRSASFGYGPSHGLHLMEQSVVPRNHLASSLLLQPQRFPLHKTS